MNKQYEQRKSKKAKICRESDNANVSCQNCKYFKRHTKSVFYCFGHSIFVRKMQVCNTFIAKQKPDLPPTIAEVLAQARKTSNFREAALSALKAGDYCV